LLQLTMFTTAIHTRKAWRRSARTMYQAIDGPGHGASRAGSPRTEIVLKRHDAYKWGPSMYQNKGR